MHPMRPRRSDSVDDGPDFEALSIVTVGPDPIWPENTRPSPVQRRNPPLEELIRPQVKALGPLRLSRQTGKRLAGMRNVFRGLLPRGSVFQERAQMGNRLGFTTTPDEQERQPIVGACGLRILLEDVPIGLFGLLRHPDSRVGDRDLLEHHDITGRRLEREALVLQAKANTATDKALDLERYRSEFFGRLRNLLGQQKGVRIVGDRFVFGSEVLFSSGNARLSNAGRAEVAKVAETLKAVADRIPEEINWVLRVDGHTDDAPVVADAQFEDNWELSTERALSVVRYLANELNIPPNRLAANGFGSHQPLNPDKTPAARAQNRRIELKLTEK